jgi:very-short-patch-repair endonuclease
MQNTCNHSLSDHWECATYLPYVNSLTERARDMRKNMTQAERIFWIEIDGTFHQETKEYDEIRSRDLHALGIRVIRYTNNQIECDLQSVLKHLSHEIDILSQTNKILRFPNQVTLEFKLPSQPWEGSGVGGITDPLLSPSSKSRVSC